MIVQATKAKQADFVRDFVACSDNFSDESESSQSEDDEDDQDHYRQSRKSLPGYGNIKGIAKPSAGALNFHAVSGKSLPGFNGDSATSPHISSGEKLPSTSVDRAHDFEVALNAQEGLPPKSLVREALDESAEGSGSTIHSSESHERGPRKVRKHAPMTAEQQERNSALLRAKLAEFQVIAPEQKSARGKKRKSRADTAPATTKETKSPRKAKKRKVCEDDLPPAQKPDVDSFLFGPLPRPNYLDPKKRRNKKDKTLFLHPDLQTLMAKLDRMGAPWDDALQEVVQQSSCRFVSAGREAGIFAEATSHLQRWKSSHHQHLTRLVDMLVHYAVVPINVIKVPANSACSLAPDQLPSKVFDLEKTFNQFGTPFEQALWNIVEHIAMRVVDEKGEVAAVEQSVEIAHQWTLSNRQHFRGLTSMLERLGVVMAGKVIVPYGDRLILPRIQSGMRNDSAFVQTKGGVIKLESGHDKS